MRLISITLLFALLALTTQISSITAATLKGAATKGERAHPKRRLMKSSDIQGPNSRNCDISGSNSEVEFECKASNIPEPLEAEEESSSSDSNASEMEQAQDRGIFIEPAIEIRDKIKYKVETGKDGVVVKVEYEQEFEETDGAEDEIMSGETSTEFEILFESIIEYASSANSSTLEEHAYDWESDEIIQTLELKKWADLSTITSDEDGVVSHFMASLEDQKVAFNFTISRADQGDKLTANTMKIDVHIVDFPWSRNDTFLALLSTVSSTMDVDVEYDDEATVFLNENVVTASNVQIPFASATGTIGFIPYGTYEWESEAEVVDITSDANTNSTEAQTSEEATATTSGLVMSGVASTGLFLEDRSSQLIQVVATSPVGDANETTRSIAYSFLGSAAQNASYIYWDPVAGVDYEREYVMGSNGQPMGSLQDSSALSHRLFSSAMGAVFALLLCYM